MKTYILDIIPKIQRFSQKLDNLSIILNKHWVILDEETSIKSVFIFREKNNQLLISNDGKIEKGSWEYLGNNSLLIDRKNGSFLFKHGFIDDYVLALKVDGKEEYALLVNEEYFEKQLKTISKILKFLNEKYIEQKKSSIISIPNLILTNNPKKDIDNIETFDSINNFSITINEINIPKKTLQELHVEKNFLLYSIEELDYYVKFYKSKNYPFYAALLLDKMKIEVPTRLIEKLISTAKKDFGLLTINEVLIKIANKV